MTTLYISNLNPNVTESQLMATFGQYGDVSRVVIMKGNRKHFTNTAFVDMQQEMEARLAVAAYDGSLLADKPISIRVTTCQR